jgi:hypothetical protein
LGTYSITAPQLLQYTASSSFADPHVWQYFAFAGVGLGGGVALGGGLGGPLGFGGGAGLLGVSSHSISGSPLSSLNDPVRISMKSTNTPMPNNPYVNRYNIPEQILFT